jgi:hypothetical protein
MNHFKAQDPRQDGRKCAAELPKVHVGRFIKADGIESEKTLFSVTAF